MLYWKGVETKADKILKEQKKILNTAKFKRPQFVVENKNMLSQQTQYNKGYNSKRIELIE